MPANPTPTSFENLREAFCHRRRCRPEKFVRKVFWRTLSRAAVLPALFGGGHRAEAYQKDLETIEAIGDARSSEELERALEEFFTLNLLERDFWRGTVGLRISGERLARLFRPLVARLHPPPVLPAPKPSVPEAGEASSPDLPTPRSLAIQQSVEYELVVLRKLRRVHELVTGGRLLNVAVGETGLELDRFEAVLTAHAVGRPELAWLHGYVVQQRELEALRNDNARLTRLVAELSVHLNHSPALRHAA